MPFITGRCSACQCFYFHYVAKQGLKTYNNAPRVVVVVRRARFPLVRVVDVQDLVVDGRGVLRRRVEELHADLLLYVRQRAGDHVL